MTGTWQSAASQRLSAAGVPRTSHSLPDDTIDRRAPRRETGVVEVAEALPSTTLIGPPNWGEMRRYLPRACRPWSGLTLRICLTIGATRRAGMGTGAPPASRGDLVAVQVTLVAPRDPVTLSSQCRSQPRSHVTPRSGDPVASCWSDPLACAPELHAVDPYGGATLRLWRWESQT